MQFGQVPHSAEGTVNNLNFTLWSEDGALTLQDLDLTNVSIVVNSDGRDPQELHGGLTDEAQAQVETDPAAVNGMTLDSWSETLPVAFSQPATEPDVMSLMTLPPEDDMMPEDPADTEDDMMAEAV